MLEILKQGLIESDEQVKELALLYGQVVIPDEDMDLTHWWLIREDGTEMLYVGTQETFTIFLTEQTSNYP